MGCSSDVSLITEAHLPTRAGKTIFTDQGYINQLSHSKNIFYQKRTQTSRSDPMRTHNFCCTPGKDRVKMTRILKHDCAVLVDNVLGIRAMHVNEFTHP